MLCLVETKETSKAAKKDMKKAEWCEIYRLSYSVVPALSRNPKTQQWIPAPRFRGDKFTPAKAGAGMTVRRVAASSLDHVRRGSSLGMVVNVEGCLNMYFTGVEPYFLFS